MATLRMKEAAITIRQNIDLEVRRLATLKEMVVAAPDGDGGGVFDPKQTDIGEVLANIMLSRRHLEDARMRLGKAIQASEGGISPLP